MKKVITKAFFIDESTLDDFILNFESKGEPFGDQKRNSLKLFEFDTMVMNVKSFKIPNIINQVVYTFFRKSKAQRSYENASKLLSLHIGTPKPIAYYEFRFGFLLRKSYYVSEQLDCDYTYRDLTNNFNIKGFEDILRAFTRFTFNLHENNILFLDHSPGNTLIKKNDKDGFDFFLVDLNRMIFKPLDFEKRIENFSRLTIHEKMVEIMSDEYAKCMGEDYEKVFNLMWKYTVDFQKKYNRKKRLKKRIKFWER